jgi:hypothetical protein
MTVLEAFGKERRMLALTGFVENYGSTRLAKVVFLAASIGEYSYRPQLLGGS